VEDGARELNSPRDGAIAVIGGGWAGCAAAVALAQRGVRVELFEAAPVLGGRARRVDRGGLALDNGQHLLLGAYTDTIELIRAVHAGRAPLTRLALRVVPFSERRRGAFALTARPWRAPFGLLAGFLTARGLSVRDRIATLAWFARLRRNGFECPPQQTVSELLSALPANAARSLWAPLCISALNTPVAGASAAVFANVLRAAFDSTTASCDLVLPSCDLSALFPEAAARFVTARGGTVTTGARVRIDSIGDRAVTLSDRVRAWTAAGAIVAVGPHQLDDVFDRRVVMRHAPIADALDACARLDYEPIATVYLGYRERVTLPCAMSRLDDAPGQWLFDRRDILSRPRGAAPPLEQIVAVVISASGPHDALDRDELVAACDTQLRRLKPSLPALAWSQAIVERRATYACVPGRPRPPRLLIAANVALAGDYVDATFPATLEAAVRTGIAAARAIGVG
jgi:squalene-associated FAD-dependent desaturase